MAEDRAGEREQGRRRVSLRGVALVAGPLLFTLMLLMPPPHGLQAAGWRVAAVGLWMILWWGAEPVPLGVTALLPLVLLPLTGARPAQASAAAYADPIVFLFLGGFLLALAMQRWGLHRRIALSLVRVVGTAPRRLVGGFMLATAFISMWVNNTATMLMMLPIVMSVIERLDDERRPNFAPALVLGVVYAASIGGLGTLIGTPPNALLAGFLENSYGIRIGFLDWMRLGVPLVAILLPLSWILLTRLLLPLDRGVAAGGRLIADELRGLGPVSRPEWTVGAVFLATDALWIGRPWLTDLLPGLTDSSIAMAAAVLLFAIPSGGGGAILGGDWAREVPWEVLLLFGGGLSLADAVAGTGLGEWIGGSLAAAGGWPVLLSITAVGMVLVLLSEVASNTAAAVTFLPVVAAVAVAAGQPPLLLALAATLAASGGFILPIASPPNAIAYGTGRVTMRQMVRCGLWMDAVFALLVPLLAYLLLRLMPL